MTAGVYEIRNTVNGRRYIGSASSIASRWSRHRKDLQRGTHHSRFLQRAWGKYGAGAFEFKVLVICARDRDMLVFYEQKCIDAFSPEYNSHPVAGSLLGYKHPPEFGAAIAARQTGTKMSAEARANLSAARMGVPLSAEHRAKLSAAHTGKTLSAEHREKLSVAGRGKKLTAAQCAHASAIRIGKPHPMKNQREITVNGETHCLHVWARKRGIKYITLLARLNRGWPAEVALSAPLQRGVRPSKRVVHEESVGA